MRKLLIRESPSGVSPRYVVERVEEVPNSVVENIGINRCQVITSHQLYSEPNLVYTHSTIFTYNQSSQLTTDFLNFVPNAIECQPWLVLVEILPIIAPVARNPRGPFQIGDRVRSTQDPGFEITIAEIQENYREIIYGTNGPEEVFKIVLWSANRSMGILATSAILVGEQAPFSPKITIPHKFTIGSDIEVSFVQKNRQVNGDIVLTQGKSRPAEFGTDHGGAVGEFRPRFGRHPMEHCNNLKKAIKEIVEKKYLLPNTSLDSSHIIGGNVVGGHIHFGIKDPTLIAKCEKNLDYWLAPTVQPLFPKNVFLKRSGDSDYGKMGYNRVRTQDHGFEYRLIPSFIFDKKVAQGIFCLAYAIVKLTIEGKLKVRLEEQDAHWIQKFHEHYNNYGLNKLNDIREESIKTLLDKNLLGNLKQHIYPLFDAIKNEKEFSGDIAEGWGMKYNYVLNSGNQEEEEGLTISAISRFDAILRRQYAGRAFNSPGGAGHRPDSGPQNRITGIGQ